MDKKKKQQSDTKQSHKLQSYNTEWFVKHAHP